MAAATKRPTREDLEDALDNICEILADVGFVPSEDEDGEEDLEDS